MSVIQDVLSTEAVLERARSARASYDLANSERREWLTWRIDAIRHYLATARPESVGFYPRTEELARRERELAQLPTGDASGALTHASDAAVRERQLAYASDAVARQREQLTRRLNYIRGCLATAPPNSVLFRSYTEELAMVDQELYELNHSMSAQQQLPREAQDRPNNEALARFFGDLLRSGASSRANPIRSASNAPTAPVNDPNALVGTPNASERQKLIRELREENETPARPTSRSCRVCFVDAPTRRAVFTSCGHAVCRACAEQLSDDAEKEETGLKCPFCRTVTGFVPLFEDPKEN